jgi:hypothetical protein
MRCSDFGALWYLQQLFKKKEIIMKNFSFTMGEEKQAHCPEVGLRGCRHYSALYNSGHHYLLQTLCEALEEARTGFGSRVMSAEELWQHT